MDDEAEDDSDAVLLGDRRCIPLCISLSILFNDNLRSSCDDGDDLFLHRCLYAKFLACIFRLQYGHVTTMHRASRRASFAVVMACQGQVATRRRREMWCCALSYHKYHGGAEANARDPSVPPSRQHNSNSTSILLAATAAHSKINPVSYFCFSLALVGSNACQSRAPAADSQCHSHKLKIPEGPSSPCEICQHWPPPVCN